MLLLGAMLYVGACSTDVFSLIPVFKRIATILSFFTCKKRSSEVPPLIELQNNSVQTPLARETNASSSPVQKTTSLPRAKPIPETIFPEETGTEVVNVSSTKDNDEWVTNQIDDKSAGSKQDSIVNQDVSNEIVEILCVTGSSENKDSSKEATSDETNPNESHANKIHSNEMNSEKIDEISCKLESNHSKASNSSMQPSLEETSTKGSDNLEKLDSPKLASDDAIEDSFILTEQAISTKFTDVDESSPENTNKNDGDISKEEDDKIARKESDDKSMNKLTVPVLKLPQPVESAPPRSLFDSQMKRAIKKTNPEDESSTIFFCCA